MTKFHLILESLLSTALTLIVTFLIDLIPARNEFLKPIRQGFLDFDVYDLYYSGRHLPGAQRDSNIILVGIGNNRRLIADEITLLRKNAPAVIGIDAVFARAGEDRDADMALLQALGSGDSIVFASKYRYDQSTGKDALVENFFSKALGRYRSGYINFLGDTFSIIRSYPPYLKIDDSTSWAFTSVIAQKFSPPKSDRLKNRDNQLEIINYSGNLDNYTCIMPGQLQYLDRTGQLKNILGGKVVLLGYFVEEPPLTLEDLHFTPLNRQWAGKSFPDMYGVAIQANILSTVIGGHFANQAPGLVSWLLAGMFDFLFLWYVLSRYKKRGHPHHGLFLLLQIVLVLLILYLFLMLFGWFHIKFALLPIVVGLVLCMELLEAYKSLALWMHRKFGFATVFNHKEST
jgi:CHASE2 domain-containing sensor protein